MYRKATWHSKSNTFQINGAVYRLVKGSKYVDFSKTNHELINIPGLGNTKSQRNFLLLEGLKGSTVWSATEVWLDEQQKVARFDPQRCVLKFYSNGKEDECVVETECYAALFKNFNVSNYRLGDAFYFKNEKVRFMGVNPYVKGVEVKTLLKSTPTMSLSGKSKIISGFISRLQELHKSGYIHNDLRLDHIKYCEDFIRIFDFNLSKKIGEEWKKRDGIIFKYYGNLGYGPAKFMHTAYHASSDVFVAALIILGILRQSNNVDNNYHDWYGFFKEREQYVDQLFDLQILIGHVNNTDEYYASELFDSFLGEKGYINTFYAEWQGKHRTTFLEKEEFRTRVAKKIAIAIDVEYKSVDQVRSHIVYNTDNLAVQLAITDAFKEILDESHDQDNKKLLKFVCKEFEVIKKEQMKSDLGIQWLEEVESTIIEMLSLNSGKRPGLDKVAKLFEPTKGFLNKESSKNLYRFISNIKVGANTADNEGPIYKNPIDDIFPSGIEQEYNILRVSKNEAYVLVCAVNNSDNNTWLARKAVLDRSNQTVVVSEDLCTVRYYDDKIDAQQFASIFNDGYSEKNIIIPEEREEEEIEGEFSDDEGNDDGRATRYCFGNFSYVVFPYFQGIPVHKFLKKGEVSFKDKIHFSRSILQEVAKAHKDNCVFNNIRPEQFVVELGTKEVQPRDFDSAERIRENIPLNAKHYGNLGFGPAKFDRENSKKSADRYAVAATVAFVLSDFDRISNVKKWDSFVEERKNKLKQVEDIEILRNDLLREMANEKDSDVLICWIKKIDELYDSWQKLYNPPFVGRKHLKRALLLELTKCKKNLGLNKILIAVGSGNTKLKRDAMGDLFDCFVEKLYDNDLRLYKSFVEKQLTKSCKRISHTVQPFQYLQLNALKTKILSVMTDSHKGNSIAGLMQILDASVISDEQFQFAEYARAHVVLTEILDGLRTVGASTIGIENIKMEITNYKAWIESLVYDKRFGSNYKAVSNKYRKVLCQAIEKLINDNKLNYTKKVNKKSSSLFGSFFGSKSNKDSLSPEQKILERSARKLENILEDLKLNIATEIPRNKGINFQ